MGGTTSSSGLVFSVLDDDWDGEADAGASGFEADGVLAADCEKQKFVNINIRAERVILVKGFTVVVVSFLVITL
jgi:hypothetical protein